MKKTLKLSAVIVVLLTSFALNANNTDPRKKVKTEVLPSIFSERNDKIFVVLDNPEMKAVSLEVRDGLDRLLYKETITEQAAVKKVFNFTKAYAGSYHITVRNATDVFSTAIEI